MPSFKPRFSWQLIERKWMITGIVTGLGASTAFYLLITGIRYGLGLLLSHNVYSPYIFYSTSYNEQTVFFAAISSLLGLSICFSFWIHRIKVGRRRFRITTLIDQWNVLLTTLMFSTRMATLVPIIIMPGFARGLDLIRFNLLPLYILAVTVLCLNQYLNLRRWLILPISLYVSHLLGMLVLSSVLCLINPFDLIKTQTRIAGEHQVFLQEIDLPVLEIQFRNRHWRGNPKNIYVNSSNDEFPYSIDGIQTSLSDIGLVDSLDQEFWRRSYHLMLDQMAFIFADKSTPMRNVLALRAILSEQGVNNIGYKYGRIKQAGRILPSTYLFERDFYWNCAKIGKYSIEFDEDIPETPPPPPNNNLDKPLTCDEVLAYIKTEYTRAYITDAGVHIQDNLIPFEDLHEALLDKLREDQQFYFEYTLNLEYQHYLHTKLIFKTVLDELRAAKSKELYGQKPYLTFNEQRLVNQKVPMFFTDAVMHYELKKEFEP